MDLPPDVARRLDHRLATAQATQRFPSVVAGVVRGETLLWTGAAGLVGDDPPTVDTQYRIGSISKTFVAVAIMQLRDRGGLALTDDVTDHLGPAWDVARPTLRHIRIGHLLMHTSGLGAETTGPWWERTAGIDEAALAADVAARPHPHTPGSRFHYSNVGFAILGAVLAHHHDESWDSVVTRDILHPLGLTRTTTRPEAPAARGFAVHPFADMVLPEPEHDAGAMAPAGQLWSNSTDLARWATFLMGKVDLPGTAVLSPETLREMQAPGTINDTPGRAWGVAHGLGLQIFNTEGVRWIGHGGSMPGFLAGVQACPSTGVGVFIATNTTAGMDPVLLGDLRRILTDGAPAMPTPWQPVSVPVDHRDLLGTWYWGPTPLSISISGSDGNLVLELGPIDGRGRASRFTRAGDDATWIGQDAYYAGEALVAVRDTDGTLSHIDLASFILTRDPYLDGGAIPGGVDATGWGPTP